MCQTQFVLALVGLFVGLTHSWDIALTVGDRLEFYTNATKTATVNLDSQKLTALAYNEVQNMLLYIHKQSGHDAICGYNISTVENRCYIKRNGNIQGLAFDPITQVIFFTDTKERSINWLSLEPGSMSNPNGNLLIKMDDRIPTDIAVDSCKGYVYWINTNRTTSSIERARFNGTDREVVVNASNKMGLHSLAIGQQTQKIYWIMTVSRIESNIYRADLNGKNTENLINITFTSPQLTSSFTHPNSLTVSKEFLIMVDWNSKGSVKTVRRLPKPTIRTIENNHNVFLSVQTESFVGIASNYKISEQFQGIPDCPALPSLVPNSSLKIATESEDLFCVHGVRVNGQSLCKCTPGYTGDRCEVYVCENYCFQGNCSLNEEELPECRCINGYAGDRCEVDVCHAYCLNNGTCSVNEEGEPVCQCIDDYADDRCDVAVNVISGSGDSDCNCTSGHNDSRADKNNTLSFAPLHFSTKRNLTLADLLANWQKPVATISVVVDIKPT